jgi:hypothetical protein
MQLAFLSQRVGLCFDCSPNKKKKKKPLKNPLKNQCFWLFGPKKEK